MQHLDILVTGATGQQGGAVAARALKRGHRVRAFVREPSAPAARVLAAAGATLHVGDLDDKESLRRASQGADALFAVLSNAQGVSTERRHGQAMFECAQRGGVRHVVYSSAASADADVPVPHLVRKCAIEEDLRSAGVPWTMVAPVYFMENCLSGWALAQLRDGRVARFLPVEQPLQQVALADIGSMVVHLLECGSPFYGRRIELAGDAVSTQDQARILAGHLGRPLHAEQAPLEVLTAGGSELMEDVAVMMRWLAREGFQVDIDALHREFAELEWTNFERWVPQQDWGTLLAELPR